MCMLKSADDPVKGWPYCPSVVCDDLNIKRHECPGLDYVAKIGKASKKRHGEKKKRDEDEDEDEDEKKHKSKKHSKNKNDEDEDEKTSKRSKSIRNVGTRTKMTTTRRRNTRRGNIQSVKTTSSHADRCRFTI